MTEPVSEQPKRTFGVWASQDPTTGRYHVEVGGVIGENMDQSEHIWVDDKTQVEAVAIGSVKNNTGLEEEDFDINVKWS